VDGARYLSRCRLAPFEGRDEMLFHIDDEVSASFLELVSDASALTSEA
jgi:hypothetical protein